MKQIEYALFWRFSNDHNPFNWRSIGKPTKDLESLRLMAMPEGHPPGVAWTEDDKDYKFMQRSVVTSEWRNENRN